MRRLLCCAIVSFLLSAHFALAAESNPRCVWTGMRQRPTELVEPCTAILQNLAISKEARFEALFTRGRAYHNLTQFEPALQDYLQAMSIEPNNVDLRVSL